MLIFMAPILKNTKYLQMYPLLWIYYMMFINPVDSTLLSINIKINNNSFLMILMSLMCIWFSKISQKLSPSIEIMMKSMPPILCIFFSSNLMILFFISFELILIPMMMLIMKLGYQPERLNATMMMLIYTVSFSLPLLLFILYQDMLNNMKFFSQNKPLPFNIILFLMMNMAFLVKLPMFLVHSWLPKAHVEAPVMGSMILAGVLLKLGLYGLMKFNQMMPFINSILKYVFLSFMLWSIMVTSMIPIFLSDNKQIIAYSSISHMSMALSFCIIKPPSSMMFIIIMMISHAISSIGLFFFINTFYLISKSRSNLIMKLNNKILMLSFFLFIMSNMGAPPLLNFVPELYFITSFSLNMNTTLLTLPIFMILSCSMNIFIFLKISYNNKMMNLQSSTPMNYFILFLIIPNITLLIFLNFFK